MRILLLSSRYSGGGAERSAQELFEEMPKRGVQTRMLTAVHTPSDPPGVASFRVPGERWLIGLAFTPFICDWRHVGSRLNLAKIRPGDFDLVHIHNIYDAWISLKAVHDLCLRIPSVWTFHDEWAPSAGIFCGLHRDQPLEEIRKFDNRRLPYLAYYETPRVQRLRRFLKRAMPQPTAIISPSQHLIRLTQSQGWFPRAAVHRVPYGLRMLTEPATQMDRAQARQALNVPAGKRVILMLATNVMVLHKGMQLAVDALKELPNPGNVHLLLLGGSANDLAKLLPAFTITCGYARGDAELARAYRAADLTLIPSRCDNFPFVALESLACKTAITGFRVGGVAEIIGENERGLIAERFDVAQLRANVTRLLSDDALRERLAQAGYEWVARECAMETYLQRVLAVYRSCVPPGGGGVK